MADFEIDPKEEGLEWELPCHVLVRTKYGDTLSYEGFVFDRDSGVQNLPELDSDVFPYVASAAHDFLYSNRRMANGDLVKDRKTADKIYYELCRYSTNPRRRKLAFGRYLGVRALGWYWWNRRKHPDPIPQMFKHMYGKDEMAWASRARLGMIIVGPDKRLMTIPPRIAPCALSGS